MKGITAFDMRQIALIFVFLGVAIAMGVWINQELGTTFDTSTATNETVAFTNLTYANLAKAYAKSVTKIMNDTHILGASNYTLRTQDDGRSSVNVTFVCKDEYCLEGDWNVTYETWVNSSAYLVVRNSTSGLYKMSSWLPIIGVVMAAGIVIGIVVLWYGGKQEGL